VIAAAELARFVDAGVGCVFLVAAAAKAREPGQLVPFLTQTGFSQSRAQRIAAVTPAAEALVGILLVAGLVPVAATAAAAMLAVAFAVLQVRFLRASPGTSGCRCFGSLDVTAPPIVAALRALGFAAAAVGSAVTAPASILPLVDRPHLTEATALGCLAGATYVMAFALMAQVVAFERWRPRVPASLPSPRAEEV
jgi:hypothetical protein